MLGFKQAEALRRAQDYFSRYRGISKLLSDELIEERRQEARQELRALPAPDTFLDGESNPGVL